MYPRLLLGEHSTSEQALGRGIVLKRGGCFIPGSNHYLHLASKVQELACRIKKIDGNSGTDFDRQAELAYAIGEGSQKFCR